MKAIPMIAIGVVLTTSSCATDQESAAVFGDEAEIVAAGETGAGSGPVQALPSLGWIGHRGERHQLRDLASDAYRAQLEDDWARQFEFESAVATAPSFFDASFASAR
jgi:hypothetical protein